MPAEGTTSADRTAAQGLIHTECMATLLAPRMSISSRSPTYHAVVRTCDNEIKHPEKVCPGQLILDYRSAKGHVADDCQLYATASQRQKSREQLWSGVQVAAFQNSISSRASFC